MIYRLLYDPLKRENYGAVYTDDQGRTVSFLFDETNTDYQQYLKWLEEGNQPLPAENE